MSRFSSAIMIDYHHIRHMFAAFERSTEIGKDTLVDHLRWAAAIHLSTIELFVYPLMETTLGAEAVARNRALFAPVTEIIKRIDKHIEVKTPETKNKYCPKIEPDAYAEIEKLWSTYSDSFTKFMNTDLLTFEAKLSEEDSMKLYTAFDLVQTSWAENVVVPWSDRMLLWPTGGAMLDTPPEKILEQYTLHVAKDEV
ncbi:hypothetical protein DL93DRAFT_2231273 [Clavulina sp. PMI_390]|nr:hypothetical protein DL93DRAFT_2231273 [Clavulina sp. PMI_390]